MGLEMSSIAFAKLTCEKDIMPALVVCAARCAEAERGTSRRKSGIRGSSCRISQSCSCSSSRHVRLLRARRSQIRIRGAYLRCGEMSRRHAQPSLLVESTGIKTSTRSPNGMNAAVKIASVTYCSSPPVCGYEWVVGSTNIERSFVHGRKRKKKKINFFGFYPRCSLCRKRFAIRILLQVFTCSEICDAFAVPKSVIALSNTANKQNLKKKDFLGAFQWSKITLRSSDTYRYLSCVIYWNNRIRPTKTCCMRKVYCKTRTIWRTGCVLSTTKPQNRLR